MPAHLLFPKLPEHNVYFRAVKFSVFTKTPPVEGRGGNRQINKDARSRKLVSWEMSYYSKVGGLDETERQRRAVRCRKRQRRDVVDALACLLSRKNRPRSFQYPKCQRWGKRVGREGRRGRRRHKLGGDAHLQI